MTKFLDLADAHIDRSDANCVTLRDHEGDEVHKFPAGTADDAIHAALSFANKLYAKGMQIGQDRKAREVRMALNIHT